MGWADRRAPGRPADRYGRLARSGLAIVNDSPLPLVCFTHDAIDGRHLTTQSIVDRVLARGRCWISHVMLQRRTAALRACITSFDTSDSDLAVLMEDLGAAIEQGLRQQPNE